jgi:hypothetical protein
MAMEDVVRFYWHHGGEDILPYDAIAEADRRPLQVRLRVLRDRAPALVGQLEQGRFVAAAWPSHEQVVMIGCHPNLARRSDDAVCLDTRNLPQVVLKLRGWEEGREAARLLLAAFGGEASDERECYTARLALRDWLLVRNQGETAAVVQRYFTFPIPPLGPISRVGLRTAAAMKALAEAAGGQWPLPESAEAAWRRFVIRACREDVALDAEELTRWFIANGWDAHGAAELTKRFGAEAAFLAEYEEEARPA